MAPRSNSDGPSRQKSLVDAPNWRISPGKTMTPLDPFLFLLLLLSVLPMDSGGSCFLLTVVPWVLDKSLSHSKPVSSKANRACKREQLSWCKPMSTTSAALPNKTHSLVNPYTPTCTPPLISINFQSNTPGLRAHTGGL